MSAVVRDIFCEREKRSQVDRHREMLLRLWDEYDETVLHLDDMPKWMLLKVMTACRLRLKEK